MVCLILNNLNRDTRAFALVRRLENLDRPPDATDPFQYTGKCVLPFVTADLFSGALPFVYFVVYPEPGNAAKPELRVRFLKSGRLLATRKFALPPAGCIRRHPDCDRGDRQAGQL